MASRPKIPPAATLTALDPRGDAPPVKTAPGTPAPVPVANVALPLALALVDVGGALVTAAAAEVFFDSMAGVATTRGVPLTADADMTAGVATVVRTRLSCALETMVSPAEMMMVCVTVFSLQTVQIWQVVCCAAAADVRWVMTALSIALVLETSTAWDLVSWTTVVPFSAALVLFSPSFF